MKRWNGWGDEAIDYPIPESAIAYLTEQVGASMRIADTPLEQVLAGLPEMRLPEYPGVTSLPAERLRHARGQSLPDWISLRSGQIDTFPDGVAYPTSDQEVSDLLNFARKAGVRLIPYGGGTSVVGHINPMTGNEPVLTIDLSRLSRMLDLDETSRLVTFEAGVVGPELEQQLQARGYTLGHYPQSFEYSTLGGWVATRSNGQQSHYYGRIEDLFAGGRLYTPLGVLNLPPFPASAAGPDLRQVVLGSEGRLGVITQATLRIHPKPVAESFRAYFFPDWTSGVEAVRHIAQAPLSLSMVRLDDARETETTMALSGKDQLVAWATRGLRLLGYKEDRCLLILGFTCERDGERLYADQIRATIEIMRVYHGLSTGTLIGEMWRKTRFRTPYLRNTLWERGYALDTLETSLPWSGVLTAVEAIKSVLREGLAPSGERVLAFAHLSSVYNTGASIYITYLFRRSKDPAETLHRWEILKGAASRVIVQQGGTISHQHGVGIDHAPYLEAEKGALGMQMLEAVKATLDPDGIMNPGKLIP
jgi:alkyldihydroxyacetonephosphate synthase